MGTISQIEVGGSSYDIIDNTSGYITDAGVTSFNGQTGAVTYTAPVTSVNGSTGAVTISVPTAATDIGAASSSHTHGNITNSGDITTTAPTIASGDKIIINDESESKITNGPSFGTSTATYLRNDGTWATPAEIATTLAPGIVQPDNSTITIDGNGVISSTNSGGAQTTFYGTCGTPASTAAKVVTCDEFELQKGTVIFVQTSTTQTYTSGAITLNVNSTGAKTVYNKNSATSSNNTLLWNAGSILQFIYDGTYWRFVDSTRYGESYYATCSDTGTNIQLTISNYVQYIGALLTVQMTANNSNISAGKNIVINGGQITSVYKNNAVTSTTNTLTWASGDVLQFIYDGAYWRFVGTSGIVDEARLTIMTIAEVDALFEDDDIYSAVGETF